MFDHLEFKVENLEVSKEFYKKVLGALDIQLLLDQPELAGFGTGKVKGADGAPRVELLLEQGPRQKPRMHVAFSAPSPQHVDAFHKTALDCGARDNGNPD